MRVAYGMAPGRIPSEVFSLILETPDLGGRPWEDDDFVAALDSLTWAKKHTHRVPYTLEVRKRHYSWGADGAGAEVLLFIANHGVGALVDAAVVSGVMKVFKQLKVKVNGQDRVPSRTPSELAEYAKWRVRAAFRDWLSSEAELTLVGESREADGVTTFDLVDDVGNQYQVEIHLYEGRPYAARVVRRAKDGRPS